MGGGGQGETSTLQSNAPPEGLRGVRRRQQLLLRRRSRLWLPPVGRPELSAPGLWCCLVRRRCRRHIFGSLGFVHRSLGLVVATIGTCQSGTAEQGCDTQYQDETKDSLHIGLLLCVGCPLGSGTLPQTLPHFPRPVKRPGPGTAALAERRDVFTAPAPAATRPSRSAPVGQTDLDSQSAGPASAPQQRRRH